MDDQRLAAGACGPDVGPESLALPVQRLREPVVVQPRFSNRNDLGVPGEIHQRVDRRFWRPRGIGMYAHRGIDVVVSLGTLQDRGKLWQRRTDAQRRLDPGRLHAGQHAGQVSRQLGKRQMAMGVNEHG